MKVCQRVAPIFEAEPRVVLLQSPVYVFGDIHGNLEVCQTPVRYRVDLLRVWCESSPCYK